MSNVVAYAAMEEKGHSIGWGRYGHVRTKIFIVIKPIISYN